METSAPLLAVCPDGLHTVQAVEWEEVELAVDSGASDAVIPEDMVLSAVTQEGVASKKGVECEVANGIMVPNLGEKRFICVSNEGISRRLIAQVCDVNKGLLSVSKITKGGSRVVFDDESYIEDKNTKERMHLEERNGMYMLTLWTNKGF